MNHENEFETILQGIILFKMDQIRLCSERGIHICMMTNNMAFMELFRKITNPMISMVNALYDIRILETKSALHCFLDNQIPK